MILYLFPKSSKSQANFILNQFDCTIIQREKSDLITCHICNERVLYLQISSKCILDSILKIYSIKDKYKLNE
jgi:hypothetical protein